MKYQDYEQFEKANIFGMGKANVNHWHGAKSDSWFSHLAMAIPGEETSTEWREPVGEEEYQRLEEV